MPAHAISCRGLTKVFGQGETAVAALRGIDLDIPRGELTMLVGPSGCGKTTLISVLAGILDKTGGELQVLGEDPSRLAPNARTTWRGHKIGFVFQSFNLIPALSAAENVAIPLLIRGLGSTLAARRALELLDQVGLAHRAQAAPSELSGGQQQRVAIARALVHDPELVVCDEPTSALDHDTGTGVMQLLKATTAQAGRSLVVVTHDARIFGFADRIAHMDDGSIVAVETPSTSTLITH